MLCFLLPSQHGDRSFFCQPPGVPVRGNCDRCIKSDGVTTDIYKFRVPL